MARSIFMPEMTNLQVREYLKGGGRTVIVPVGSTEDHGDHGPLWTDVYIPLEVANRAAPELDALVAPPIGFGLAPDHRGASGLIYVRLETFIHLIRDVCVTLAQSGFTRIVLLNGHYVNSWALQYAAANVYDELPEERPDLSVPLLAGAAAGAGRAVPVRDGRPPRERWRDLRRPRDRPRPVRHGARARFRAGPRRAADEPVRAARSGFPLDAGLVLVAARAGRRRVGEAERVVRRARRAVP